MKDKHPCPNCGKPMVENPKWRGHWTCPDSLKPLNSGPPYKFKCYGMAFEPHAVEEFNQELLRLIALRN